MEELEQVSERKSSIELSSLNNMIDEMYSIFETFITKYVEDCGVIVKSDLSKLSFDAYTDLSNMAMGKSITYTHRSFKEYTFALMIQGWLKDVKQNKICTTIIKSEFIKIYGYDPYPLVGNKSHLIICNGFERKIKIKNLLK